MIRAFHFLVMKVFHYTNNRMSDTARRNGLYPGQPKILESLLVRDGQTPKELCQACALDKSTMTGLLKKMEDKGLIKRQPSSNDRRSIRVYLTGEGREKGRKIQAAAASLNEEALSALTPDERETLIFLLNKILDHLEECDETSSDTAI